MKVQRLKPTCVAFLFVLSAQCQLHESEFCRDGDPVCQPLSVFFLYQTLETRLQNKITFVSTTTTNGWMTATTGADSICAGDASSKGLSGTYRAMLAAGIGTFRTASVTANLGDDQVDWVLSANTNYFQEDGTTLIGTTGADALLAFPLTNSIGTSGFYWTAMNADWTTTANYCNDGGGESWNFVGAGAGSAELGSLTATDSTALSSSIQACSTGGVPVVCVEQ